ncbi:MAG: hypothetical protein ACFCVF_16960 [Kineosporiaceae bacterium]
MTDPGDAADPRRPDPPPVARVAYWLMHTGAILAVVVGGVTTVVGATAVERAALAGALGAGPDVLRYGVVILFSVMVVMVEVALWMIFGRLFRRGYAWARWAGTALAAANLASEGYRVLSPPDAVATIASAAEVVLAVALLLVLWSPAMSRYVAAVSRWRSVAAV